MEHIFWTIINQIHITPAQGQMIITAIPVVMFGWIAREVWNTIGGRR